MAVGAYLAIHPDGNGWGYPAFVVLCALLAGVAWVRRNDPLLQTAGILLVMSIVGLMLCGALSQLGP